MSLSSKVPLIKAVRQAMVKHRPQAKLLGADLNDDCIGQHFVDFFWPCPALHDLRIESFVDYCNLHRITIIIPTRDGELLYFAKHKQYLANNGIYVMVSNYSSVELCLDKLLFSRTLQTESYPVIPSFDICPEGYDLYVVKERFGAGSSLIGVKLPYSEAIVNGRQLANPIYQPFIDGDEFSVDVYVSGGVAKGAIVRSRDFVIRGESQVTTSVRMPNVEKLIMDIAEKMQLEGHAVFQIILDSLGGIHLIECDSRIGGASTLSFAMGLTSIEWFLLQCNGYDVHELHFTRSECEKRLIRHAEDYIL